MRHHFGTILPLLSALLLVGACDDDDGTEPEGPFDLTFEGDATFQGPHGDQDISIALLDDATGTVLGTMSGTISAADDPSFSFTFGGQLTAGESYSVAYWIDSNFGEEGVAGTCDPPEIDHQWLVPLGTPQNDLVITETHDPGSVMEVCDSF